MNHKRPRHAGREAGQGRTVPDALERLILIDETLAEAYEQALPHIKDFEARYHELTQIIHQARQVEIDWKGWAFSSLGYRPREGGYFHTSESDGIVDHLEQAVWALRRSETERWKWFGVALHGAAYGLLVEILRKAGVEVTRHAREGQAEIIDFEEALAKARGLDLPAGEMGGWLGRTPEEEVLHDKALLELAEAYRQRFVHIRPSLGRPLRLVDFIDQVATRALRSLAVLALDHCPGWRPGQRLRLTAALGRLADLLLIEYGRLQGETMQLLCRAHYAGVPLQSRKLQV